jgi:hypothetical protein
MALFGRKSTPPPPDEALSFFDAAEADRFRTLVRAVFAERGLEVTVLADHLVDADGRQFGLWNLAAACHAESRERRWRGVVEEHVTRLLSSMDGPDLLGEMTPEQAAGQVYVRLYEAAGLPDTLDFSYATEPMPGVVELLAIDFPETVSLLPAHEVERLGGAAALRAAGLENLRRIPDLDHQVLPGPNGIRLDVVTGDSVFTASLAVLLPELLQRVLGTSDAPDGVFVALPFRHQLVLHVLRDAGAVLSLNALAGFAVDGFGEGIGALSPWVYWWRDGSWQQVTATVDDELAVTVSPELQAVLSRLAAGGLS